MVIKTSFANWLLATPLSDRHHLGRRVSLRGRQCHGARVHLGKSGCVEAHFSGGPPQHGEQSAASIVHGRGSGSVRNLGGTWTNRAASARWSGKPWNRF